MTIRILIADDHAVLRQGLAALVALTPGLEVAGLAGSGTEAVRLAVELCPDVAVLDVGMPDLNGIEVARRIAEEAPDVRVLALSASADSDTVAAMLRAGARGYLLKEEVFDALATAILAVAQGEWGPLPKHPEPGEAALSVREMAVIRGLASGQTYKMIARELGVSARTVETYRQRAGDKLRLRTVAELVGWATRRGLL
jgi:DNA-binding NarL/FixJ family response regulator